MELAGKTVGHGPRRRHRLVCPPEHGAGFGQKHAPASVRPSDLAPRSKSGKPSSSSRSRTWPAQSGLGEVQLERRPRDVFRLGHGDEVTEMTQFHARSSIALGYAESRNMVYFILAKMWKLAGMMSIRTAVAGRGVPLSAGNEPGGRRMGYGGGRIRPMAGGVEWARESASPMKRALRLLAAIAAVAGVTVWLSTGANRGWTRTSTPTKTIDPVTGIEGIDTAGNSFPGSLPGGRPFWGPRASGARRYSFAIKRQKQKANYEKNTPRHDQSEHLDQRGARGAADLRLQRPQGGQ